MISDEAFILELQQQADNSEKKPIKEERKKQKPVDDYKYIRDDEVEQSLSAHYGSEND